MALTSGGYNTCVVLSGGGVECWGANGNGQLGTGDLTDRDTPTALTGLGKGDECAIFKYEFTLGLFTCVLFLIARSVTALPSQYAFVRYNTHVRVVSSPMSIHVYYASAPHFPFSESC